MKNSVINVFTKANLTRQEVGPLRTDFFSFLLLHGQYRTSLVVVMSAEKDRTGKEYLSDEQWQKMGTGNSFSSRATRYFDSLRRKVTGDLDGDDLLKVLWLSSALFFIVGGYWLLRSLKDPIMSVIDGVEYIPQAKIASLFVVFALVIVCKLI